MRNSPFFLFKPIHLTHDIDDEAPCAYVNRLSVVIDKKRSSALVHFSKTKLPEKERKKSFSIDGRDSNNRSFGPFLSRSNFDSL